MTRLEPATTVLIVVDLQERLAAAMDKPGLERIVGNVVRLLEVAQLLQISVLATEQYPKGLGRTLPDLAGSLAKLGVTPIEKMAFDACDEPAFSRTLARLAPRAALLVGMEAHVCVFQTARELVRRNLEVHVVADAVLSRTEDNLRAGLALAERAGAVLTTTEASMFDLVRRAGTDTFRAVSKLVKG